MKKVVWMNYDISDLEILTDEYQSNNERLKYLQGVKNIEEHLDINLYDLEILLTYSMIDNDVKWFDDIINNSNYTDVNKFDLCDFLLDKNIQNNTKSLVKSIFSSSEDNKISRVSGNNYVIYSNNLNESPLLKVYKFEHKSKRKKLFFKSKELSIRKKYLIKSLDDLITPIEYFIEDDSTIEKKSLTKNKFFFEDFNPYNYLKRLILDGE